MTIPYSIVVDKYELDIECTSELLRTAVANYHAIVEPFTREELEEICGCLNDHYQSELGTSRYAVVLITPELSPEEHLQLDSDVDMVVFVVIHGGLSYVCIWTESTLITNLKDIPDEVLKPVLAAISAVGLETSHVHSLDFVAVTDTFSATNAAALAVCASFIWVSKNADAHELLSHLRKLVCRADIRDRDKALAVVLRKHTIFENDAAPEPPSPKRICTRILAQYNQHARIFI
jgi:hypothetical protein